MIVVVVVAVAAVVVVVVAVAVVVVVVVAVAVVVVAVLVLVLVIVFASGWKTARVVVLLFQYGGRLGGGGVGWDIKVHVPCVHRWMLRCCYVNA